MKNEISFSSSDRRFDDVVRVPHVVCHMLEDDGTYPNNQTVPLVVYQGALTSPAYNKPESFEELFATNRWGGSWRDGVYGFHHYHSTAHEVLGVYSGSARIQFGGPSGVVLSVGAGDAVVIPAGVAHKNLGGSADFRCVGAYPDGGRWDMNYGKPDERPRADENIARVPLPKADPVYGAQGPLVEHWGTLPHD
jgi:uncharacterized protein YjlB